jgi:hypothetical protein
MAGDSGNYCNDCAWPYECAAARNCHRRDLGQVRSAAPAGRRPSVPLQALPGEVDHAGAIIRAPKLQAGGRS